MIVSHQTVHVFKGLCYTSERPIENNFREFPQDWFIIQQCDSYLSVGKMCDTYISGINIIKEVHMQEEKTITIYIGSHNIKPEGLGLPSNIQESTLTFKAYLEVIDQLKLC